MSLRGRTIEETAELPEGGSVLVRVGIPEDSYIPRSQSSTVDLQLLVGDEVVASVETILDPDQESEAVALAREVARGIGSGELALTAGAIEPLANRIPETS